MDIYNNVLLSVARASAPELISIITPTFNSMIVPSVTLLISIIGSLITLQTGTKDLLLQYSAFTNGSGYDSIARSFSHFKIMDVVFDELGTNQGNCSEEFACEIARITAENVPLMKFLATKVWSNSTSVDSNSYLDLKEKTFIRGIMDAKNCEKRNFDCKLIQKMKATATKIKYQILTTTTTTTTTPAPIVPRSRFGLNYDLTKYLEILNEIILR